MIVEGVVEFLRGGAECGVDAETGQAEQHSKDGDGHGQGG